MPLFFAVSHKVYSRLLILIAGVSGLLYGIDVGIIAAALLYLDKTINLTIEETGWIVSAVFAGSTLSSLIGGFLADKFGRKKMMVFGGLLFISSVVIIVLSQSFAALFMGRLLQGASCGVIAVVVPLYLAETLSPKSRGTGSAVFQLMLTLGIGLAAVTGNYYAGQAGAAIGSANGNTLLIRAAQDHAWRSMFLSVTVPGIVFFFGTLFLSESPRWLFRKGRKEAAIMAMLRSSSRVEADLQIHQMEESANQIIEKRKSGIQNSVFQRKYMIPFLLACLVLAFNQATGINSILSYLVLILRQAGMTGTFATKGDMAVKWLNVLITVVAVVLIDRRGRKFLLALGTLGAAVALICAGVLFHRIESQRIDVALQIRSHINNNRLDVRLDELGMTQLRDKAVAVTYAYNKGSKVVSVASRDEYPVLQVEPAIDESGPLTIKRATYGPMPSQKMGWWMTAFLSLFIAAFAIGPGVVVWLALSELMPTRIRSVGMGIALLINQGISMMLAGVFLPAVGRYGYSVMFFLWALCTAAYFMIVVIFLPETKGRTLEEIEIYFSKLGRSTTSKLT